MAPVTAARRPPRPRLKTIRLGEDLVRTAGPLRVDRDQCIIYGVKVAGLESKNRRRYALGAYRAARSLYEGLAVNIDHPGKGADQRSAYDRFGRLLNVRIEADGPYADLHYLKTHPMAERIVEAAERMPGAFGLSHNAEGRGEVQDGVFLVTEIVEVHSVDLVADPATTKGLFEQRGNTMPMDDPMAYDKPEMEQDEAPVEEPAAAAADPLMAGFEAKLLEIFRSDLDWQTKKSQLGELLKAQEKAMMIGQEAPAAVEEDDEMPGEDDEEEVEESARRRARRRQGSVSLSERRELEQLRKERKALELMESLKVQPTLILRKALTACKDEQEMRAVLKEHQAQRPGLRPRSQAPGRQAAAADRPVTDGKSFAAAILRHR